MSTSSNIRLRCLEWNIPGSIKPGVAQRKHVSSQMTHLAGPATAHDRRHLPTAALTVQPDVELRILEPVLRHQDEEAVEGEHANQVADVHRLGQEVAQEERVHLGHTETRVLGGMSEREPRARPAAACG